MDEKTWEIFFPDDHPVYEEDSFIVVGLPVSPQKRQAQHTPAEAEMVLQAEHTLEAEPGSTTPSEGE